jgi:uncharacterized SAM-binding protein YcdF (DUF218 family)
VYLFKQWVGAWLNPLPIAIGFFAIAIALRSTGRRRSAVTLTIMGAFVAFASSLGGVGNALLTPLETRHAAMLDARSPQQIRFIAVLGSSYHPRQGIPVTAALDSVAMVRLIEGIRLLRQQPQAILVLSGGAVGEQPPVSAGYAEAAMALGVRAESILQMNDVLDTAAEIRTLHTLAGDATVVLVTSAAHMPRAMEYCELFGVAAIAAPTGHLAQPVGSGSWHTWLLPTSGGLRKTETALHEYLGLLAMRVGLN